MRNAILKAILPMAAAVAVSSTAFAAEKGISKDQLDALMAQPCFAKIDQKKFDELKGKYVSAKSDLQALCGSGKNEEAQELAFDLADMFEDSEVLNDVAECGKVGEEIVDKFDKYIDVFGLGEEGEAPPNICELAKAN